MQRVPRDLSLGANASRHRPGFIDENGGGRGVRLQSPAA
jgi:hypothetical protein